MVAYIIKQNKNIFLCLLLLATTALASEKQPFKAIDDTWRITYQRSDTVVISPLGSGKVINILNKKHQYFFVYKKAAPISLKSLKKRLARQKIKAKINVVRGKSGTIFSYRSGNQYYWQSTKGGYLQLNSRKIRKKEVNRLARSVSLL